MTARLPWALAQVSWAIRFSLKAHPNVLKAMDSGTVLVQGTSLRFATGACTILDYLFRASYITIYGDIRLIKFPICSHLVSNAWLLSFSIVKRYGPLR
jgi:hypothetical protein